MKRLICAVCFLIAGAGSARAQLPLPLHFQANAGIASPVRNEKDFYKQGIHVGVGAKIALIPLQVDAAYDRMGGIGATKDLSILSLGASAPISVTPPLLPVGVYFIVGGGLYRHDGAVKATDFGVNGGVGARVGIPGISLYAEARGVAVLDNINKLTYFTVGAGIRL